MQSPRLLATRCVQHVHCINILSISVAPTSQWSMSSAASFIALPPWTPPGLWGDSVEVYDSTGAEHDTRSITLSKYLLRSRRNILSQFTFWTSKEVHPFIASDYGKGDVRTSLMNVVLGWYFVSTYQQTLAVTHVRLTISTCDTFHVHDHNRHSDKVINHCIMSNSELS